MQFSHSPSSPPSAESPLSSPISSPTEVQPLTAPLETEVEELAELGELESETELDPESIVEAAEALLREGAPHDYDVVIIGAGPGGLACASRVAEGGLNVALIEEREVGGVCLNRGCIPTKTLLESVGALRLLKRAQAFGITLGGAPLVDFSAMQTRTHDVVAELRSATLNRLEEAGVSVLRGKARFVAPHTIEVSGAEARQITAVHVVIATGGVPARLPVPGADLPGVLTSDEILKLNIAPRSLVVVGGGAVGVEFAQIFVELGTSVTLLEKTPALLPGEDAEIQSAIQESITNAGVQVLCGANIRGIEHGNSELMVNWEQNGEQHTSSGEFVLLAAGRKANLEGLNLEEVGIEVEDGKIEVDDDLGTSQGGVWAIGDCIRRVGWAHQAAREGTRVSAQILGVSEGLDPRYVPSCYYTFPEVASVGLTQQAAQELGIDATAGRCNFRHNGRAATSGDNEGFVKVVIERGSGQLLGAQIIGPRATELINEIAVALREGATADDLADALHAHPTFAEVLPGAARAALRGAL
jgi:dihydrolipoamide dehydrogenase